MKNWVNSTKALLKGTSVAHETFLNKPALKNVISEFTYEIISQNYTK